jgi:hypothetical protein
MITQEQWENLVRNTMPHMEQTPWRNYRPGAVERIIAAGEVGKMMSKEAVIARLQHLFTQEENGIDAGTPTIVEAA